MVIPTCRRSSSGCDDVTFLIDCQLLFPNVSIRRENVSTFATMMDPLDFIRLSIGSLGLRIPISASKVVEALSHASTSPCHCEIQLRGFPIQTAPIPLISSSKSNPDPPSNPIVFYLEKSDLKALLTSSCFQTPQPFLEVAVYLGKKKKASNCSIINTRQKIGSFKVEVGPEWGEGKPSLIHNGWIVIGKKKQVEKSPGPELHLRVKLDLDPRYVFEFDDETALSPQIVQVQGNVRQPIFSCKFSRDRRTSQLDPIGTYWSNSNSEPQDAERRERKGWKVMIHGLSGSAAAAAFMATPFVPSTNRDIVSQSNPGSWLIVRPDPSGTTASWHPWGRLEVWREIGTHNSICLRLFLLPEGQERGVLVSEVMISADKGGEFFIDMDTQTPMGASVQGLTDGVVDEFGNLSVNSEVGGFVMNCKVKGQGKCSKPLVQLAMRHVTCVEDAAIFMALGAAVDLSMEACRPFRRKAKKGIKNSLLS